MVVIHPEYAMLILEVNDLKDEIADLIVERDVLKYYTCRDIEIEYILKIGTYEYKLILASNTYKRSLRKLEIIEEKISKKQKINMASIERKLNVEFKEDELFAKDISEDIDIAIEMNSTNYFDYDSFDDATFDYFKLQKLYNPIFELNPLDDKIKMYKKIQSYFQKGNFKKIHKLAEKCDEDELLQDEIAILKRLREKYFSKFIELQKEIDRVKKTFPYNQKIILSEDELCRRKKAFLNKEILKIKVETEKVEKEISKKLKKYNV